MTVPKSVHLRPRPRPRYEPGVHAAEVHIPEIVLRVDRFDRPTETVDATFHFRISQSAINPAAADED